MPERNNITTFRKEVLIHVARAFWQETEEKFYKALDYIPFSLRPKNSGHSRCCLYKDRAVLRFRSIAALGFRIEEEEDDSLPISHYGALALQRERPGAPILTVCDIACKGCIPARYYITDICQGCTAQHCKNACRFGAISFADGRCHIDAASCKNCGKCKEACPYQAVVRLKVPCEDSCPVKAIHKSEKGLAEIDTEKCISCGRCMRACPFGTITERSEVVDVLRVMRDKKHCTALIAPAIVGQFGGSLGKVVTALKELGFDEVMEVALGADITSEREAEEFVERMKAGRPFMTTSCCPGYVAAVKRHMPALEPFVSETGTPMHYTAELARKSFPDTVTVFIGPCVAKRFEGLNDPLVDYVLTFEETGALFEAKGIEVNACGEAELPHIPSGYSRGYALSGGVAAAVQHTVGDKWEVKPVQVDGLSVQGLRTLRGYVKSCPGNLVEVMACEGGCVAGAGVWENKKIVAPKIAALANAGK